MEQYRFKDAYSIKFVFAFIKWENFTFWRNTRIFVREIDNKTILSIFPYCLRLILLIQSHTPFFPGITQRQVFKSVFPEGKTMGEAYKLKNNIKSQNNTENPAGWSFLHCLRSPNSLFSIKPTKRNRQSFLDTLLAHCLQVKNLLFAKLSLVFWKIIQKLRKNNMDSKKG